MYEAADNTLERVLVETSTFLVPYRDQTSGLTRQITGLGVIQPSGFREA